MKASDPHHALIDDANDMLARLSCALAIAQSAELHAKLRERADLNGVAPLLVQLPESSAWLKLRPGQATQVCRAPQAGVAQISMMDSLQEGGAFWQELLLATRQTGAQEQAFALLSAAFDPERSPSADQMASLLEWSPVIDRPAYRYFTRGTELLTQLRSRLRANWAVEVDDSGREFLEYWGFLHAIADVAMFASTPEAAGWLTDMAKTFVWRNWTPSFALIRERTLWLAAVAARAATAFGDGVADDYVSALGRADHPVKGFDALFGLVAIGLTHERRAGDLTREIERAALFVSHRDLPDSAYVRPMLSTALLTLKDPAGATKIRAGTPGLAEAFRPTPQGLMGKRISRRDPTEVLPTGHTIGLLALPRILGVDGPSFYPADPARQGTLKASAQQVREVLRRAWSADGAPRRERVLHWVGPSGDAPWAAGSSG
jgi:hypothetical protein